MRLPSRNTNNIQNNLQNGADGGIIDANDNSVNNGGNINGSADTELLAGRTVSAVGGGDNSIRQQGANTHIIRTQLGALSSPEGNVDGRLAAGESAWISETDRQPAQEVGGGLDEDFLRGLRGVDLRT